MGAVSIFYSDTTFGKSGMITFDGKQPCFTLQFGDNFYNNAAKNTNAVIATDFSIKKQENVSVTPTLGEQMFLYVGGETAWEIDINGLALLSCKDGTQGFDKVIEWYNQSNVKTTGKSMKLSIGKQVYDGYLWKFAIQSEYKFVNAFSFTASFVGVLNTQNGQNPNN